MNVKDFDYFTNVEGPEYNSLIEEIKKSRINVRKIFAYFIHLVHIKCRLRFTELLIN